MRRRGEQPSENDRYAADLAERLKAAGQRPPTTTEQIAAAGSSAVQASVELAGHEAAARLDNSVLRDPGGVEEPTPPSGQQSLWDFIKNGPQ